MKDKYIVLLVGKSGTGKSTICQYLENMYELKEVKSYTTRPKRNSGDTSHKFVDEETFDDIISNDGVCAYTEFNGYKYCATSHQIDNSDLYIVDPNGVDYFIKNYSGRKIPMVVYIDSPFDVRKDRMRLRGDSEDRIESRIKHDEIAFKDIDNYAMRLYNNRIKVDDVITIGDDIYNMFFREIEREENV